MINLKDKKVLLVAALAVVILGVGAFQVLGGGDAKPAKGSKSTSKAHSRKSESPSGHKAETPTAETTATAVPHSSDAQYSSHAEGVSVTAETTATTNHEEGSAADVSTHKALEYESAMSTNSAINTNGASAKDIASSVTQMSNLTPSPLPERDPFWVPPAGRDKPAQGSARPLSEVGKPVAGGSPSTARPIQRAQDTVGAIPPDTISGTLPPVKPISPTAGGAPDQGAPRPATGMSVKPSAPARLPDEFAFRASGTVDGANPIAVLVDDAGKQWMVRVGEKIGGARVVKISNGVVVVRHNGKLLTLRPGGSTGKP